MPGWCNQPLTQVAERICELDRWYAGRQNVFFAGDPLLPTAPGAQHEQKRSWNWYLEFKKAGCA
ncbi:MAG: hypothetical protein PVH77_12215 [Phycisphaerales bacterium]